MRKVLRKGQSSAYFMYEGDDGDSIGIRDAEAVLVSDSLVIRFALSPVDGNQRADAERLDCDRLVQVHFSDDYLIKNLQDFINGSHMTATKLELQFSYLGKEYSHPIFLGAGGLNFLPLMVEASES